MSRSSCHQLHYMIRAHNFWLEDGHNTLLESVHCDSEEMSELAHPAKRQFDFSLQLESWVRA